MSEVGERHGCDSPLPEVPIAPWALWAPTVSLESLVHLDFRNMERLSEPCSKEIPPPTSASAGTPWPSLASLHSSNPCAPLDSPGPWALAWMCTALCYLTPPSYDLPHVPRTPFGIVMTGSPRSILDRAGVAGSAKGVTVCKFLECLAGGSNISTAFSETSSPLRVFSSFANLVSSSILVRTAITKCSTTTGNEVDCMTVCV
jgi:hypothetical protein